MISRETQQRWLKAGKALIGQRILGQYSVQRLIGTGGMSWVYRGKAQDGKIVALKILFDHYAENPEAKARFLREGELQHTLNHPNIIHVTDFVEEGGLVGYVMEWCGGRNLEQWLREYPKGAPASELFTYFLPLIDAVGYAHEQGIVHRDLKPHNILLHRYEETRTVKLSDFGIAKEVQNQGVTKTGAVIGTPHYMSPEQVTESKSVDYRTDIYSLGVILYQFLTGDLPFEGNVTTLFLNIMQQEPKEAQGVPVLLRDVIMRCLAKHPQQRYQSCVELYEALYQALLTVGVFPPAHSSESLPLAAKGMTLHFQSRPAKIQSRDDLPSTGQNPKSTAEVQRVQGRVVSHPSLPDAAAPRTEASSIQDGALSHAIQDAINDAIKDAVQGNDSQENTDDYYMLSESASALLDLSEVEASLQRKQTPYPGPKFEAALPQEEARTTPPPSYPQSLHAKLRQRQAQATPTPQPAPVASQAAAEQAPVSQVAVKPSLVSLQASQTLLPQNPTPQLSPVPQKSPSLDGLQARLKQDLRAQLNRPLQSEPPETKRRPRASNAQILLFAVVVSTALGFFAVQQFLHRGIQQHQKSCEKQQAQGCYQWGKLLLTSSDSKKRRQGRALLSSTCFGGVARACHDLAKERQRRLRGAQISQSQARKEILALYSKACQLRWDPSCLSLLWLHPLPKQATAPKTRKQPKPRAALSPNARKQRGTETAPAKHKTAPKANTKPASRKVPLSRQQQRRACLLTRAPEACRRMGQDAEQSAAINLGLAYYRRSCRQRDGISCYRAAGLSLFIGRHTAQQLDLLRLDLQRACALKHQASCALQACVRRWTHKHCKALYTQQRAAPWAGKQRDLIAQLFDQGCESGSWQSCLHRSLLLFRDLKQQIKAKQCHTSEKIYMLKQRQKRLSVLLFKTSVRYRRTLRSLSTPQQKLRHPQLIRQLERARKRLLRQINQCLRSPVPRPATRLETRPPAR